MTQTPLTRLPLAGFTPKKARLVRKMEDHGWTGRISSNGHAIMRCPDGETTCSVSPKMGSGRGILNDEATFKRWMREHGERSAAEAARIRDDAERLTALAAIAALEYVATVDTAEEPVETVVEIAPEPEPEPVPEPAPEPALVKVPVPCTEPDCNRVFGTLQAMSVHHVRAHVRVDCPICLRPVAPGNLPRHRATHLPEMADPEALLAEVYRLRAHLIEARAEATEWERLADEAEEAQVTAQDRLDRIGTILAEQIQR